ncbi:SUMF1/EgtB/PvdO family nonheme iron enzyme [Lewinella sp. JB7]|uniref:SUMF1/EgtB/PvdO family nonheme iron enzyme n=1 Tax=Lewinella sp. JB7 TaxID=2962887 RepID=UPI0020C9AB07|nr:SUMF1/EgtB/PvdO family nonheme iron enzyme [Lewinella sp. JB7]MCP9234875.1 SUMF1/EgtB/PvdO family nonheme iron enzyme [Lewinella sp. JB7]
MVRFYLLLFLLPGGSVLLGNNIQITGLNVDYEVDNSGFALLTFDLSWDNSWRTSAAPGNWDAAWVFAKFRPDTDGEWQHIVLTTPPAAPTGATIDILDGTGAMIYAASTTSGSVNYQQTRLRMNLAANGVDWIENLEFQVFGVEMVYVPQGAFQLGSDSWGTEVNQFYSGSHPWKRPPYSVSSFNAITVGNGKDMLNFEVGTATNVPTTIPAGFPKGYRAFYAMKYELSQQQYVDFFNTLTPTQKALRDLTDSNGKGTDAVLNRNAIAYDDLAGGDASTTAPHVPVGYVSVSDMLAYLDWSGLRPMTEMEFEKLCRGPETPTVEGFAWGTDAIAGWALQPALLNSPTENITNLSLFLPETGYAGYNNTMQAGSAGPLRSGIYSASLTLNSTRVWSGAGYYGNMELSGNQAEGVITVSHTDGTQFTNAHGDGALTTAGSANVLTWPLTQHGVGTRGGHYGSAAVSLMVADRSSAVTTDTSPDIRHAWLQFRGVRGL